MPPSGKLDDAIIRDVERWILDGAADPRGEADPATTPPAIDSAAVDGHWAFRSLESRRPRSPAIDGAGLHGSVNPIDAFIEEALRGNGMEGAAEADPLVLLRRVTFDLTGLPPTPSEIEGYLSDAADCRYERAVDRLLASPQLGPRWARHWLDLVRYADSNGADENHAMPNAWRYRDWVVDAFNQDLAFDEFVRHQIAGDLLAGSEGEETRNRLITATGFWVLGPKMLAEQDKPKMKIDIVDEQIDTFSRTMLGLTLSCARCHDHKFDPFSQRDYFALAGILMSTRTMADEAFISKWMERPLVTANREAQRAAHRSRIDASTDALRSLVRRHRRELNSLGLLPQLPEDPDVMIREGPCTEEMRSELDRARKDLEALRHAMPEFDHAMAVEESGEIVDMPVHLRGNHLKPTEERIPRGVPEVLTRTVSLEGIAKDQSGRLQLARWLTDAGNPLLARVMVNRVWMWHFGQPLVASPSNFGLRGEPPTHPELLDDLASRWIEHGWSLKWLHRQIVTSRAYKRTSRDARYAESDPENRWLSRRNARRLEMEPIRDSLLACSGRLDSRLHGPPQPIDGPRRTIYCNVNRAALADTFSIFDYVDPASHLEQRPVTTVPSQALFFLNSPLVVAASETLGARLAREVPDDHDAIDRGFRIVLGRTPNAGEMRRSLLFLDHLKKAEEAQPPATEGPAAAGSVEPRELRARALGEFVHGLFGLNEFVWVE